MHSDIDLELCLSILSRLLHQIMHDLRQSGVKGSAE